MPAAKAARSAANSRTATRRGTKGLVLGGVPLPIERSDVRLRPEVIARHVPPTAASLSGEKCRGPGLGPDADDHHEDPPSSTEGAQDRLARYVEDIGDSRTDVVGDRVGAARIQRHRFRHRRRRLRRGLLSGGFRRRGLLGGRQWRERAGYEHEERHDDAEDPDSGLHQGNLLPVVLRETIVRPQGAPTAAIPGQLDDSKMIANGPPARKLDKRYNRRHILFQEAVTHEARALLYERPAPTPRHHPGRPNRRPSGKPRPDSD